MYEYILKMFAQKPTKTLNIIVCDIYQQFTFSGYNFYNNDKNLNNNNLNRTTRSSFLTAQPVESKNEQDTETRLKPVK